MKGESGLIKKQLEKLNENLSKLVKNENRRVKTFQKFTTFQMESRSAS